MMDHTLLPWDAAAIDADPEPFAPSCCGSLNSRAYQQLAEKPYEYWRALCVVYEENRGLQTRRPISCHYQVDDGGKEDNFNTEKAGELILI